MGWQKWGWYYSREEGHLGWLCRQAPSCTTSGWVHLEAFDSLGSSPAKGGHVFQASQGMSAAEANEGSSNMPGSPDDESQNVDRSQWSVSPPGIDDTQVGCSRFTSHEILYSYTSPVAVKACYTPLHIIAHFMQASCNSWPFDREQVCMPLAG